MGAFRKKRKGGPRVCVFGVDGMPHTLLRRLMDQGVMPRARGIFGNDLRRMRVTLPEVSSVSWSSFMTGANPGTHGIYGFTDFEKGSYRIRFPSFASLKAPTIWDRLGKREMRSVVVNQPSTYPAREIPGVLVSGFVAVDLKRAVWPLDLARKLKEVDYEIDLDTQRAGKNPDYLFGALQSTLRGREKVLEYLWEREEWNLFEIVVTGTDRLQHFQLDAIEDPSHPNHVHCLDYYEKVDGMLGRVYDRFVSETGDDSGSGFFALSDHGFTRIRQEFYVNAWLVQEGLLSFRTKETKSFEEAEPSSKAFGLDPTRIYLHRKDRFPNGCVEAEEVPELCAGIAEKILSLRFGGEQVFRGAFRAEEVYSGPELVSAPDLVLLANDGFDVKGWMRTGPVFGRSHFTGMHNWDDAFFWSGSPMPDDFDITGIASEIEDRLAGGV
ncbi:MAG: alkaline phosphatase family protein [Candidatus Eisenbacteria bacterium]